MALINLFDRIWSLTLVYAAFVFAAWQAGKYTTDIIAYGILLSSTVLYLTKVLNHVDEERRVCALGKHAPSLRSPTPFNLGTLASAVYYFSIHKNHVFWTNIFKNVGNPKLPYTVESVTVGQRLIFTADEKNIQAILATQFQDYGKGPNFRKEWKDFLGLSIFTTDGELWHNSRSLLRPQFIKDRVSDLHTFEHHVQELLPMLAGTHKAATIRLDDLIYRYTLDAATGFLFGRSVGSLKNGETEFANAFTVVQNVQATIVRAGPVKALVPRKKFHEALATLNKFTSQYIDEALALPPSELEKKSKSDEGYTFLHALAGYTRDRQVLRDQLVAVLLAGRDTTAVTLSWLFYEISKQPKIVERLQQDIQQHCPDNKPTYENLKSMRYLNHVINETLRLYPVVPYNVRVALQDTTLPHGGGPDGNEPIGITKDTPIAYSTLVMQRREDIYPSKESGFADHLTFVPERWENWTPRPFTYIPFNGGPRICIGQQFALTEMAYTVVRILQTYKTVENRNDGFPGLRSDIVLQPQKGVYVAFS